MLSCQTWDSLDRFCSVWNLQRACRFKCIACNKHQCSSLLDNIQIHCHAHRSHIACLFCADDRDQQAQQSLTGAAMVTVATAEGILYEYFVQHLKDPNQAPTCSLEGECYLLAQSQTITPSAPPVQLTASAPLAA